MYGNEAVSTEYILFHTISCLDLKSVYQDKPVMYQMNTVKSLTSMYQDKLGTYEDKPGTYWYMPAYTRKKANWKMCMMMRLDPRTSCIPSCVIYHYATSLKSLVI